jgi:hypothetical protein
MSIYNTNLTQQSLLAWWINSTNCSKAFEQSLFKTIENCGSRRCTPKRSLAATEALTVKGWRGAKIPVFPGEAQQ